jgi:hypothetical protein
VRNGKGMKDRTVYLTEMVIHSLKEYLAARGEGVSDHVFLYRNQALGKELIHARLKAAGERTGIHLHAHRLRHTCGTQLLNSGCPVTSIQKLLGHKKLNTTMVYARAYDATVEADYFAAMGRIEQRLELVEESQPVSEAVNESERAQLLTLAGQLFAPEMSVETRLEIAAQMCGLLDGGEASRVDWIPPPISVSVEAI